MGEYAGEVGVKAGDIGLNCGLTLYGLAPPSNGEVGEYPGLDGENPGDTGDVLKGLDGEYPPPGLRA